jgi:tRNA dimethylallyltransferase
VHNTKPIILLLGPTAGGKTETAIELAQRLPGGGELISADSMQVYRDMDIGTAKPTAEQRERAPHHLIDLVDAAEEGFSVDTWLDLAEKCIAEVRGRGKWPIVVGGTNLYVQAFLEGLFEGPPPDDMLREKLNATDAAALRKQLERIDPEAARTIHANDRKRTIRAIEVFEQTGKRISELQTQWQQPQKRGREDVFIVGLDYPVEAINRRINARVGAMMTDGLLDEVRTLHDSRRMSTQAREALGYKQLVDHLEGRATLDEAVEQIKIRTRRYAKQQRTWLRRFRRFQPSVWIDACALTPGEIADRAIDAISASDKANLGVAAPD